MAKFGNKRGGRPGGENSNSGKGLMTSYTRKHTSSPTMTFQGAAARSNGVANMKGRATKNWSADPNRSRKKN
jgi:hypothetical protein